MDENDRKRGRRLALWLGIVAVLLAGGTIVADLVQGDGFSAGRLAIVAAGLVVIAATMRKPDDASGPPVG